MPLTPDPLHISVGSMDGHTQVLFYSLCFGPLVILAVVAYRQQKRLNRELEQEAREAERPGSAEREG